MPDQNVEYLGDGVYVENQDYQIKLMTGNHLSPSNTVYLDKKVWEYLKAYAIRVGFDTPASVDCPECDHPMHLLEDGTWDCRNEACLTNSP